MFGHGCPLAEPDPGAGVVLDDDAGVADEVELVELPAGSAAAIAAAAEDPVVADVLCVAGAAEALVMPAAAPPLASAPAIIVAPSIFETFI